MRSLPTACLTAALVLGAALSACGTGAGSAPSGSGTSRATSASAKPSSTAAASARAPAPQEFSHFERIPIDAAIKAQAAIAAFIDKSATDMKAYFAFRRAVSCGDPFFRDRGFVTEALYGSGPGDETGGPLGRLDAAIATGNRAAIDEEAAAVKRALRLLQDSFERDRVRIAKVPFWLPRTAYSLGAILAGSRPGVSLLPAGVVADALGHLDAVEQMVTFNGQYVSPNLQYGPAVERAQQRTSALRKALAAAEAKGELEGRAALVVQTGKLGAELRTLIGPSSDLWAPYPAAVSTGAKPSAGGEPTSVLTVPRLRRVGGPSEGDLEKLASLGEKLFSEKSLSKGGARSCATCHVPDKAYTDGKAHPDSLLAGTPIVRNAPSLLYSGLQAAQFWDGRALTGAAQAELVIHSKAEMGDAAFPQASAASIEEAARALAAFEVVKLAPATAPIDRFARGDEQALSDEDKLGFDVLAGKGRCTRCHVPPLFGGSYPTDFSTPVYAVLGVPSTPSAKTLDPDPGRGAATQRDKDASSFKTPTLRNVDRTAPYFHNGAFATLESVVDFYDKGGGRGLGVDVPNQDPDVHKLDLTAIEKKALLRLLRTALADPAKPGK